MLTLLVILVVDDDIVDADTLMLLLYIFPLLLLLLWCIDDDDDDDMIYMTIDILHLFCLDVVNLWRYYSLCCYCCWWWYIVIYCCCYCYWYLLLTLFYISLVTHSMLPHTFLFTPHYLPHSLPPSTTILAYSCHLVDLTLGSAHTQDPHLHWTPPSPSLPTLVQFTPLPHPGTHSVPLCSFITFPTTRSL